tara:strand:- start:621 stop:833 length:213 start_codon:yes stop_codon:yes gene_type:complete
MDNPENDTAYAVWLANRESSGFRDHLIESLNSAAVDRAVARALLEKAEARYMLCARQVAEYEFQDEVLHY